MKVLYAMIYAPEKGGSGAPIYTHHLLKGMARKYERPGIIFSTHHSYKNPRNIPYQSIPLYFDRPAIFDNQPKVPHSIAFKDMSRKQIKENIQKFYKGFKKAIDEEDYNLLHIQHGMYIGYAATLVKDEIGIPILVSLHIMELNFLPEFPDPLFALRAMTEADKIFALSNAQKERLLNEYAKDRIIRLEMKQKRISKKRAEKRYKKIVGDKEISPKKVVICPLGIDTRMFDIKVRGRIPEDIKKINIPRDAPIVMFAGRLIEMKGIRHLLNAEPIYNQSGRVHTIILGGGELEDLVRNRSRKRKQVHYLGFKEQKEMPKYHNYAASHNGVFSVPSSSEGQSLVYLEAMACGMQVVGCCKRDMGEYGYMQPPYAFFVKFGDERDLAKEILTMLKKKKVDRKKVRSRMTKYNSKDFIERARKIYRSVGLTPPEII